MVKMEFLVGLVIGFVVFYPLALVLARMLDTWWWDRKCRIRKEKYEAKYGVFDQEKWDKQIQEGLEREMAEGSGCWEYADER